MTAEFQESDFQSFLFSNNKEALEIYLHNLSRLSHDVSERNNETIIQRHKNHQKVLKCFKNFISKILEESGEDFWDLEYEWTEYGGQPWWNSKNTDLPYYEIALYNEDEGVDLGSIRTLKRCGIIEEDSILSYNIRKSIFDTIREFYIFGEDGHDDEFNIVHFNFLKSRCDLPVGFEVINH